MHEEENLESLRDQQITKRPRIENNQTGKQKLVLSN